MRKESELKCARREVIEETGYDTKDCLKSTLFFEEEVLPIPCAVMIT